MMRANPSRTQLAAFGLLAAVITALVYLPSVGNGFVEWDDHVYVYENKGLVLEGFEFVRWAATSVVSSNWHPLTLLTYGAEYSLWGLNPLGYHLVNVLFHALNTFLVFLLGSIVFRSALKDAGASRGIGALAAAFMAALVFGIHPQHVESVSWVSERKDVLSGFFFLLSLICYMKHAEKDDGRLLYWASFASFGLALLSKPMAITLPVVLLILDYYPLKRLNGLRDMKSRFVEKLPFFLLMPIAAALTIWAQHGDEAMASIEVSPLAERVDVAVRGVVFYLEKLVYPVDLAPFYVRPLEGEFFNHVFFISSFVILAISALALIFWKRRSLAAAWVYYLVTLLPVIGLVQVSDMAAADRYSYLPALGPVFFIAGLIGVFVSARPWRLVIVGAVMAPSLVIAGFLTVRQEAVWKNTVSLWTQEIKVFPTVQAYLKRARAYEKEKMFREAAVDYTVVIGNTGDGEAKANLFLRRALAWKAAGDMRAALSDFSEAIRLSPENFAAYLNRGELFLGSGDAGLALNDFEKALSLSPENPAALYYAGVAHERAGDREKGLAYLKAAASLGVREAAERLEGR
ncbi:MAG: tetratricopeptide repeat protein [Deltaproteobacteria bacterium]|nr:tetratricopeptide repeat protein [Deltaproteobacteria bacterium]